MSSSNASLKSRYSSSMALLGSTKLVSLSKPLNQIIQHNLFLIIPCWPRNHPIIFYVLGGIPSGLRTLGNWHHADQFVVSWTLLPLPIFFTIGTVHRTEGINQSHTEQSWSLLGTLVPKRKNCSCCQVMGAGRLQISSAKWLAQFRGDPLQSGRLTEVSRDFNPFSSPKPPDPHCWIQRACFWHSCTSEGVRRTGLGW